MKPSWVVLTLLSTGFVLSVRSQNYIRFPIAGGGVTPTPVAAANAALAPEKITTDGKGNIYFVSLNCVFKMDAAGTITRVAGSGQYRGFAGDGGPAADALLSTPIGLAVDKRGNLYIVDSGNLRVRRVAPDGTIATVAGSGRATGGSVGDGGKATDASFALPYGIALDSAGNIYVSDMDSGRVRRIATDGTIGTFAGSGSADEGHACSAGSGRGVSAG